MVLQLVTPRGYQKLLTLILLALDLSLWRSYLVMNENNCSYLEYLNCHISGNTFELKSTTSSMVCSLLDKLCKSKATGLDKISAKLLRYCLDLLLESLTVIFNCSINTGIFPDECIKCSKVIPLFKHGELRDLNNYRPISIIPVVAKVFERIIYDQIYAFLADNNLLCNVTARVDQ